MSFGSFQLAGSPRHLSWLSAFGAGHQTVVTFWRILVFYPFFCFLWGLHITITVTHRRVIFFHSSAGFQGKNYRWGAEMPYCCTWKHEEENQ